MIIYLTSLFMGVLASFSPCTFPLIPVLMGQIAGKKDSKNAVYFIIGTILTNATLGTGIAVFKNNFVNLFQNDAIRICFVIILLVSLGSMMGLLPSIRVQNFKPPSTSNWAAIILYGALSALILSPCTTAPMAAAINLSINAHSSPEAIAIMVLFGIGSSTSLVIAASGFKAIKPGPWLDIVAKLAYVTIFAIAIHILTDVFTLSWLYNFTATVAFSIFLICYKRPQIA